MEKDLNNDEFEIFLKHKADQHKLYPSDKAWKGIFNALHPGMKWFKIGGTVLILTTLFIVYQETSLFNFLNLLSSNNVHNSSTPLHTVVSKQVPRSLNGLLQTIPLQNLNASLHAPIAEAGLHKSVNTLTPVSHGTNNTLVSITQLQGFLLHNSNIIKLPISANITIPVNHIAAVEEQTKLSDVIADNDFLKPISSAVIGSTLSNNEEEVSIKNLNWLQEMAAIKLTPHKKNKFNLQFYFSPTVSYRRLADNQNVSHSSILNTPAVSRDLNINRYVDHNAAIGAELGSNILFAVTQNLTIKSGLQLNYSRYNIKAFKYFYEKASIALHTAGPIADTISSYTSLRNFSGYAPEELQNQYLQVSVPVGAELKLLGNKRLQFSVAGTIQPTFLLFSDTYLLSTNYLNYTKEPSLVRKWNVHSSFEAFASYKTGGLRWQLGPQFRYQLMSSFNDRYPIKEYLFEYGVKIGVSKTLR